MNSNIDMIKTGQNIKTLIYSSGYTVKDIQEYLNLNCPQSIYRWFKGLILPSVAHLHALSKLLNVHMEELIVMQESYSGNIVEKLDKISRNLRMMFIYQCLVTPCIMAVVHSD